MPQPWLLELSIEPKSHADLMKLASALEELTFGNQTIEFHIDPESRQTILRSRSELSLDEFVGSLIDRGIDVTVGAPQVAYRETLARAVDVDYTHKKQTGGTGQFARVKLKLEPNEVGKGNEFVAAVVGGTVPKEYIPGVEKGIKSVWDNGVLIGFPIVDMKVTLHDGAYHEVDSSAIAFEIASRSALKEGCEKGGIKLLEPIMDVEVVSPQDFVGGVIGDINSRRGQIRDQQMRGNAAVIRAFVPLALMFGYVSQLRSLSQGRASHTMVYSHYQVIPSNNASDPENFPPAVGMRA